MTSERFEAGQCQMKGRPEYCGIDPESPTGYSNDSRCPIKYAFFGLVAATGGYLNRRGAPTACSLQEGGNCPEYVEWVVPWKGKEERVTITDGGQMGGMKEGEGGKCFWARMKSDNPEVLGTLRDLFGLAFRGEDAITDYLMKNLGAPADIRARAFVLASNRNEARISQ